MKAVERQQYDVILSWLRSYDGEHNGMDCSRPAPVWQPGIDECKRFDGDRMGSAVALPAGTKQVRSTAANRAAIGAGCNPVHCVDGLPMAGVT